MPKNIPKYCPFCGADTEHSIHDDDCKRPTHQHVVLWWSRDISLANYER